MTKVMIFPDEDLDKFYERTINYLQYEYHSHSTTIKKSDVEVDKYNFSTSTDKFTIPNGKRVY